MGWGLGLGFELGVRHVHVDSESRRVDGDDVAVLHERDGAAHLARVRVRVRVRVRARAQARVKIGSRVRSRG